MSTRLFGGIYFLWGKGEEAQEGMGSPWATASLERKTGGVFAVRALTGTVHERSSSFLSLICSADRHYE